VLFSGTNDVAAAAAAAAAIVLLFADHMVGGPCLWFRFWGLGADQVESLKPLESYDDVNFLVTLKSEATTPGDADVYGEGEDEEGEKEEMLRAASARERGNALFGGKDVAGAVQAYSEAIE